jgi:hypothetical protein
LSSSDPPAGGVRNWICLLQPDELLHAVLNGHYINYIYYYSLSSGHNISGFLFYGPIDGVAYAFYKLVCLKYGVLIMSAIIL